MALNADGRSRDADHLVGLLLRWGLSLACALLAVGLTIYLSVRWGHSAHLGRHADAVRLGDLGALAAGIHQRDIGLLLMQIGLLVLVALQVARIALYSWLFLGSREWPYVAMTLFLLALMLYGLL